MFPRMKANLPAVFTLDNLFRVHIGRDPFQNAENEIARNALQKARVISVPRIAVPNPTAKDVVLAIRRSDVPFTG